MITVVLENPASASLGDKVWHSSSASRAHNATRSDLTLPLTNKAAEIKRMITVVIIFLVVNVFPEINCKDTKKMDKIDGTSEVFILFK